MKSSHPINYYTYFKMQSLYIFVVLYICASSTSNPQHGPDPWHFKDTKPANIDEFQLPPDLRIQKQVEKQTERKYEFGEWWFKRLLAIMLKSGQVKKSDEDGSTDISLQMRFEAEKWDVLNECLKSESTLSDVTLRRALGYIEDGIYKPTIKDKIIMAWSDYIQVYLTEYKIYITWVCGILGALGLVMWLWNHVSHKHLIVLMFLCLYIYEVIISYKEAEQQEYDKFVSAMNTCKWFFWTSDCTIPSPDPLVFMKHMNPLKIAIRMFTTLLCEPILSINSSVKEIIGSITDGLWFPFDKIVYGVLIVVINISLIYMMIMVIFNYIFNIPFKLNVLGLVNVGVEQRKQLLVSTNNNEHRAQMDTDRISGDRLDKILNVCSLALSNNIQPKIERHRVDLIKQIPYKTDFRKLQRSSSTGRLPSLSSEINRNELVFNNVRKRNIHGRGEGDH